MARCRNWRTALADLSSDSIFEFTETTCIVREPGVTWRRLDQRLVVAGGGSSGAEIVGEPGSLVWDLMGRRRQFGALVDDVVAVTGAKRSEVGADMASLLTAWLDRGWIVIGQRSGESE